MSEAARAGDDGAFRLRTVVILLAVGIAGFVGMLVLGAYAPDLKSGNDGGAHALSNAATGYSGIVRLAEATGRHPRIIRDDRLFGGEELLVITPEDPTADVSKALARGGRPTLVVLPKWLTTADPDHSGWVRRAALDPSFVPAGVLSPAHRLAIRQRRSGGAPLVSAPELPVGIRFRAPRPLQVVTGVDRPHNGTPPVALDPLVTDGKGGIVLGKFADAPLYVLADPDLLSNQGLADVRQAGAALAMLDWLNSNHATSIGFDVTLNGLGKNPSPLKLAFEPPFLAMTLAIAAALLLAGLHAFGQFGAPAPRERAIAFGKAALVDNTAALVRKAGRQARLGGRYAAVVRERARVAFGVPARAQGEAVDAALDRLPGRRRFTELAAAADRANTPQDALAAARALYDWQGESRVTVDEVTALAAAIRREVGKAVIGQEATVELMLVALFAGGHILLEGPPGTAKTLLAHSFARAIGLQFGRIQFTPDLMPGDIIGANLFNFQTSQFSLTRGPIFTELLLADEINRTPPKTQAALLEAMQERTVTIDGQRYALSPRFTVVATQNPIEQQGVYPLPEAQLDRFLFKQLVDYPSAEEERRIVANHGAAPAAMEPARWGVGATGDQPAIDAAIDAVRHVRLVDEVVDYVAALIRATREVTDLESGASPRAGAMLAGAARARAALDGRDFVIPDDVKALAPALLRHRLILSPAAEIDGRAVEEVVSEIVESIEAPR